MKIVVFRIGGQEYAADIRDVREVIRSPAITPLPHPTPPLVGVFNLRGHIVTALDGNAVLGVDGSGAPPARAVIFQGRGRTVGLMVDAASHVLSVDEAGVRPPTEGREGQAARGIIIHEGRPIVLLDVDSMLGHKPIAEERAAP